MNKLELESVSFLNESPTIGIGIGLVALYATFIAGVAFYAKKKLGKYYKDYKNKNNIKSDTYKRGPTLEERVEGYCKVYKIDKNFFDKLTKKYKTEKEVYNDMLHDAKEIANKIKTSDIFKANCNEAEKYFKDHYTDEPADKFNYNFFKSIISISEGVDGYETTMQILDSYQDVIIYMNWIVNDIADMLEIKYSDYLKGGISTGDGDEGTIYYSINIK